VDDLLVLCNRSDIGRLLLYFCSFVYWLIVVATSDGTCGDKLSSSLFKRYVDCFSFCLMFRCDLTADCCFIH